MGSNPARNAMVRMTDLLAGLLLFMHAHQPSKSAQPSAATKTFKALVETIAMAHQRSYTSLRKKRIPTNDWITRVNGPFVGSKTMRTSKPPCQQL